MKKVLVLCTGNSCRSQMAEAFFENLGRGAWEAASAGTEPTGRVHPGAIEVMREVGLDLSRARSKSIDEFVDSPIDLVVTVCSGARESCPHLPLARRTLHWPFDDPAHATGCDEERLAVFRRVRDEIRARIEEFLEAEEA